MSHDDQNSFSLINTLSLDCFNFSLNGNLSKQVCAGTFGRILGGNATTPTPTNNSANVREYHEVTGDIICPSMVMGIDHLRDPRMNKVRIFVKWIFQFVWSAIMMGNHVTTYLFKIDRSY